MSAPKVAGSRLWVQNPAIDLIVGCGAWSAPLLLLSYLAVTAHVVEWSIAFYALTLFFNYPHYMATIYRAFHTTEDFRKYRIFTVHITALLALTVLASHFYVRLLPWIFTLYLSWSPWHYSGQNYGLFMMFARRGGANITRWQRRALYSVFLLSYLVLFLNLHSGPSTDQLFISLALPIIAVRRATVALALLCTGLAVYGLRSLYRQIGRSAIIPPVVLLSTQFLWFLVPSVLASTGRLTVPQSRYSTGVMALMHSAQYLWITSYYAKREAGSASSRWRPLMYFVVLVAGGIALFVPGPWLASYLFHFDFTSSFLIFTALVNLHHFILDGAIWKLRDGRIASLLLNSPSRIAQSASEMGGSMMRLARWSVGPTVGARTLRIGTACVLLLLAAVDQTRFVLGMSVDQPSRLRRAAAINPYDGSVQIHIAREAAVAGRTEEALDAYRRAEEARPTDRAVRDQFLQYLISQRRYQEAFQLTSDWMTRAPKDADLMVNRGILASALGDEKTAEASWEQALAIDPAQPNAHLYLAQLLDRRSQSALALSHYRAYLTWVSHLTPDRRPNVAVVVGALLRMADCLAQTGDFKASLHSYDAAEKIANEAGDRRLQSITASAAADFENKQGDFTNALRLYQQALRVDSAMASPELEASDLSSYAELLREHHLEVLAYACLLRARSILQTNPAAPEFAIVDKDLKELESKSNIAELARVRRDPDPALEQALALPN